MAKISLVSFFLLLTLFFWHHPDQKKIQAPKALKYVSSSSAFIKSQRVTLKNGPPYSYNAALFPTNESYFLLFRFEDQNGSYIGKTTLNSSFEESSEFQIIDTQSHQSQDARIFEFEGKHLLVYNDSPKENSSNRFIKIAELIGNQAISQKNLDLKLKKMEKNWSPFVYQGEIYLEYALNPRKILRLNDLKFIKPQTQQRLLWQRFWGKLRGGTPAQRVGDEYLAFFHSTFKEKGHRWYVMGAYTFEAKPPFRITKMSKEPILFDGIYDSLPNPRKKNLYCLYPVGFVIKDDKLHLSCGENDSSIKILTFDLNKLLQSLSSL